VRHLDPSLIAAQTLSPWLLPASTTQSLPRSSSMRRSSVFHFARCPFPLRHPVLSLCCLWHSVTPPPHIIRSHPVAVQPRTARRSATFIRICSMHPFWLLDTHCLQLVCTTAFVSSTLSLPHLTTYDLWMFPPYPIEYLKWCLWLFFSVTSRSGSLSLPDGWIVWSIVLLFLIHP
jgi:hypothetical protein